MDNFTLKGLSFRVEIVGDDTGSVPWKEYDGHGPVRSAYSNGPTLNKSPGERVLGRSGQETYLYDFAAASKLARADEWGISPEERAKHETALGRPLTRGEVAHWAVEADFMRLSRFIAGDWNYIGVVVTLLDIEDAPTHETESLWAVESDADAYHDEVARELAGEIAGRIGRRKYVETRVRVRV